MNHVRVLLQEISFSNVMDAYVQRQASGVAGNGDYEVKADMLGVRSPVKNFVSGPPVAVGQVRDSACLVCIVCTKHWSLCCRRWLCLGRSTRVREY